ncbi:hypothetical protein NZD88_12435 [Chryseobacterium antibioticum]|uniref:Bacteriocin n=1 Tax=Chryseobacterium pyrolae TaxID=2987481 RepID=A0ABT2II96_9FLAO|nr:hypothetical protein [Chryseobacterium pyrolae]MCT2408350.1 hypothetical protein [Chryseobacterium pyrolae]
MKNLKKLNRDHLREVMGGHTCPNNLVHVEFNGYHACCLTMPPLGNPCKGTFCFIPEGMCSGDPM